MRKRRAQAANLTANVNTRQAEAEENRQALVLFFIVILFLVCNLPRIILNCYEVFIITKVELECFTLPAWVIVINLVNHVLMVTNSSINFFVYCFVNTTFRAQFLKRFLPCLLAKKEDGDLENTVVTKVTTRVRNGANKNAETTPLTAGGKNGAAAENGGRDANGNGVTEV